MNDHQIGTRQRFRRPPRESRRDALRGTSGRFAKLRAHNQRMGWSFPRASSFDSDFNFDFRAAHTAEDWASGAVEYNFRTSDSRAPLGRNEAGFWWRRHDEYPNQEVPNQELPNEEVSP